MVVLFSALITMEIFQSPLSSSDTGISKPSQVEEDGLRAMALERVTATEPFFSVKLHVPDRPDWLMVVRIIKLLLATEV